MSSKGIVFYKKKCYIEIKRSEKVKKQQIYLPGILCFISGIIFVIIGIIRQEHLTILKKAINICLECIGIG